MRSRRVLRRSSNSKLSNSKEKECLMNKHNCRLQQKPQNCKSRKNNGCKLSKSKKELQKPKDSRHKD